MHANGIYTHPPHPLLKIGVLTLKESLMLSIQMRRNLSQRECETAVKELIKDLELSHVGNALLLMHTNT